MNYFDKKITKISIPTSVSGLRRSTYALHPTHYLSREMRSIFHWDALRTTPHAIRPIYPTCPRSVAFGVKCEAYFTGTLYALCFTLFALLPTLSFAQSSDTHQSRMLQIDTFPPVIDSTIMPDPPFYPGPFDIYTKVTDSLSGVDSVYLWFKRNEDPDWFFIVMHQSGFPDWYVGSIPPVSLNFDTVRFYIQAFDAAEPPNQATDPENAPEDHYWFVVYNAIEEYNNAPEHFSFNLRTNPAKGKALFSFVLPSDAILTLSIYDASGRLIAQPISGKKSAGMYDISWSKDVGSGVYFYSFDSPWGQTTGKLVLLK